MACSVHCKYLRRRLNTFNELDNPAKNLHFGNGLHSKWFTCTFSTFDNYHSDVTINVSVIDGSIRLAPDKAVFCLRGSKKALKARRSSVAYQWLMTAAPWRSKREAPPIRERRIDTCSRDRIWHRVGENSVSSLLSEISSPTTWNTRTIY